MLKVSCPAGVDNYLICMQCFETNTCAFLLVGDLNARTRDLKDFIPRDDLQYIFGETDYERDYYDIPRNNKDRDVYLINQFGQSLIDL